MSSKKVSKKEEMQASVGGGGSAAAAAPATTAKKTRAPAKTKTKVAASASASAEELQAPINTLGAVPEGALASQAPVPAPHLTPPDMETEYKKDSSLKFCPVCDNYLYMQTDPEFQTLVRICRACGHKDDDQRGGLVMEMMVQERSAEGYKILLNEFTRRDPRLPHIRKNIKCPNGGCDSNKGASDPDIIYIKYDNVNLLYLYICDICGEQWRSGNKD